jgi:hypothetical protein
MKFFTINTKSERKGKTFWNVCGQLAYFGDLDIDGKELRITWNHMPDQVFYTFENKPFVPKDAPTEREPGSDDGKW